MTNDQLAELLSGIAKSQNAMLDAVDRAMPCFKATHLGPVLNIAANIRQADPRLIDLPSRVLLRLQGRVAPDQSIIVADLDRLLGSSAAAARPAPAAPAAAPVSAAPAAPAPRPAPAATPAPAAATPLPPAPATPTAPAPAPAAAAASDDPFNFLK